MAAIRFALAGLLFLTCSAWAQSWRDNSHYVALGPRTGYYFLRPGSRLQHQLGFDSAPYLDTADPFRHGDGADALAFRFDRASLLIVPPAYIVQGLPNVFYLCRLSSLIRGRSSLQEVEALFGRPSSIERYVTGFIAYYEIPVYNSFEDRWDGGRR